MEEIANQVYKRSMAVDAQSDDFPIHQIQEDEGINWIVIENNIVYNATNSYYEQIRQPNGDIYLRLVDIFKNTKNRSRPQVSQQADDHTDRFQYE